MGLARALETQTTEHNNLKTNQILLKQQQHSDMTLNSAALPQRSFLSLALPVARLSLGPPVHWAASESAPRPGGPGRGPARKSASFKLTKLKFTVDCVSGCS